MAALKSESSSPLYYQLMQRIRENIDQGIYGIGTRIPPEHDLERTYQVSRVTVRRALAELTSEEKNAISHRGNALRAFIPLLREAVNGNNR